jgi:hypothetical protein
VEEIQLDLRRHCVETEIKKLYNLALGAYFRPGADKQSLEARIGLLALALEGLDFPALRGRYPDLCGGGSQPVVLFEDIEGVPRLRVGELLVDTAGEAANRPKGV